jgi:ABC-type multidrug transport system fused ATPase/permease subunit
VPDDRPVEGIDSKLFWRRVGDCLKQEKRLYVPGIVFVLLSLGSAMFYPQLVRVIIDQGIQGGRMDRINELAMIMAGVLVVQAGSTFLYNYCFQLAATYAVCNLKRQLFGNLLLQEVAFYDVHSAGELSSRLQSDVGALGHLISHQIPEGIRFTLMGLIGAVLMVYMSPMLALVIFLAAPLIWVGTQVLANLQRTQSGRVATADAKLGDTAHEVLAAIRTVRVYHQEKAEHQRYAERLRQVLKVTRQRIVSSSVLEAFTDLAAESAVVVGIWVGGVLIVNGTLTAGALVTFLLYAGMVVRSLRNMSRFSAEIMRAQGGTSFVLQLSERRTAMPVEGGLEPTQVRGVVALEGVHFAYPSRPEEAALAGIDLVIEPGQTVALVGASGSGKSTIASLIARLYDPDRGRVSFDGIDLRELDPAWLRQQVTLVPADATLFARSIAENIRYGRPEASEREVIEAARIAHAEEFVERFAEGYDTASGDRGLRFSNGQRQRLAIARAVLRRPRVLILDEATAALDSEGEELVKGALRKLPDHPSLVIVAHRLSTVVDVDRVILIQHGKVAAVGSHEELLRNSDAYRDLVENQLVAE